MKKKGMIFSRILQIIVVVIIISILATTILDKNFYYDTLDFIQNLFEPPEIDPQPSITRMLIERENGLEYLSTLIRTIDEMNQSNKSFCYEEIPPTTISSREEEIAIIFETTKTDSFDLKVTQKGGLVSVPKTINSPLCMVAQPKKTDNEKTEEILENFVNAFYHEDEDMMNECINDPEKCSLILSKPELISAEYANNQGFNSIFQINADDIKEKKLSFFINYYVTKGDEQKSIMSSSSGRLTEAGFILFKLDEHICLIPLSKTSSGCDSSWITSSNKNAGDIKILKRTCAYAEDFETTKSILANTPKCSEEDSLLRYENEPIFIEFTKERQGILSDVRHPKKIEYLENKWEITYNRPRFVSSFPLRTYQSSELIINYLEELLKDKNYREGVETLCDEFENKEKIELQEETDLIEFEIKEIKGLSCRLVRNP